MLPSLHHLAADLVHNNAEDRLDAARTIVMLVSSERYDGLEFAAVLHDRVVHGCQPLARTVKALEDAMLLGAMPAVWPTLVELSDRVAGSGRLPAGSGDLLRTLARYVGSVPEPVVPQSVRDLAERGRSGAAAEARALVAAVDSRLQARS